MRGDIFLCYLLIKLHNQAFKLTNKNFICEFNVHIPVEAVRSTLFIGDEED